MNPHLRSVLNGTSIAVTAFLVLVFLVGDWTAVYGANVWMRVLWLILLSSTQTFLGATWKLPSRWRSWIGVGRWTLVGLSGFFFALAGVVGLGLSFVPGLFVGSFGAVVFVGLLLLAEGVWMLWWISKNGAVIREEIAGHKAG